ncbi:MAG: TrkH family potassium uptake protein [Xanthomonadales bacterium]|nr:TrkH family potassium uptake protein [Xanthomonadales bacterium]
MHWRSIARLFGILLVLYSISFAPSVAVALWYSDGHWFDFTLSLGITAFTGLVLWLPNTKERSELSVREGFLVVTLFWVVLGFFSAMPFIVGLHLGLTDAVFESISGFTTTGATVIVGLDQLPPSLLYHRQQIQWLGGMGIIVLAVAILPLLGVGGMQLYRAEASGVSKQDKLTPRIAETARLLWFIYFGFTVLCAAAYWAAGMSLFDAVCHAFTTIATGGFSTHDASIGYFDDPIIETIAIVFMLAGGVNFAVHFMAWKRLSTEPYSKDTETRSYAMIFGVSAVVVAISLYLAGSYDEITTAVRHGSFQVASILTSTGFGTATYGEWPLHIPFLLVLLSFTGGCAGSTAGGIKVVRIVVLAKLGLRQLYKLVHSRAVVPMRIGRSTVSGEVLYSILGFYALYVVTSLALMLAMMAAGLDLESALGAVVATINLLGPGLGDVAANFASVSPTVKWLGIFGMLVGRLEVFTLLILFLPAYWRN